MQCPLCTDQALEPHFRLGIEIDVCPHCKGVWLDRGELDRLAAEPPAREPDRAGDAPAPAPAPVPGAGSPTDAPTPERDDRDRNDDRDRSKQEKKEKQQKRKRKKPKSKRLTDALEDLFDDILDF